jgi:type II secretory pathway component PulJ
MPQLIALTLVGAGLYAGYRWFSRATREVAADMQRAQDEMRRRATGGIFEKDMGRLEFDPVSGVYRPAQR